MILGFDTGWVHFVSDDGQLLIAKQFLLDKPVIKIRVLNCLPPKRAKFPALSVGRLSELLIIHPDTIVSIDNNILMNTLITNRAEAAQARSKGSDFPSLNNLPARKYKVREQERINDVSAFAELNISFNQLHQVSMNKQLLNEDHLKSLGYVVSYLSAGSGPVLQLNSPHPLLPTNINELAQNVVSTVKSGLLKAASGFFWGASDAQAEEDKKPADPEQKLEVRYGFKDHLKEATCVELSPDSRFTAIFDVQNRVLLFDNFAGTMLHSWKGYHHAQFGWIHTMKDRESTEISQTEFAILLVIYLPRRGLIEVWSPDQKSRVAHFPVSKRGQLLTTNNSILDLKMGPSSNARTLSTVFLEPSGQIRHIFIPIHALTDKSSIHDSNMQAQLKAKLESEDIETESLIELIKSAKSAMSKLHMMKEILKFGKVDKEECQKVMDFLQEQVETSQVAKRHCEVMSKALSLFDYLTSVSDQDLETDIFPQKYEKSEDVQEDFQCTSYDSVNFFELYKKERGLENGRMDMDMASFMACFQFLHDNADDSNDNLPLKYKNADSMMKSFLQQLSLALAFDYEKTLKICQNYWMKPQDLLQVVLKNSTEDLILKPKVMFKLFQLCFDLQQNDEELSNFQILLQSTKSFLVKSNMNFKLYSTILLWKSFLSSSENMSSYSEDWSQILHFTKSFIDIRTSASQKLQYTENFYNYKDTFQCGSGKIVEIVTTWFVDSNIKSINKEDIQELLKVAELHFPCSMQTDILKAHLTWEYCHRWQKAKGNLQFLQDTLDCLEAISRPEIQHRLTRLLWNILLNKPTKDAINLTEIRSATRCERELGFAECELPHYLQLVCQILNVQQKTDQCIEEIRLCYDVTTSDSSSQRHLLDVLARMQLNIQSDPAFALYHQITIVSSIIWNFGLEFKPLSLFSNQEISMFFNSGNPKEFKLSFISQNRGVRNARKRFLEVASEGAVACIHFIQDQELDTAVYEKWAEMIKALALHWNLGDKLSDIGIVALYKAGFDALGEEIMSTLADKEGVSRRLLRIAMLRLGKHLSMNEQTNIHLSPEVQSALKSFGDEVDEVSTVNLDDTKNLLVALSHNEMSDSEQQNVYEWLAVAQSVMRYAK